MKKNSLKMNTDTNVRSKTLEKPKRLNDSGFGNVSCIQHQKHRQQKKNIDKLGFLKFKNMSG